MPEKEKLTVLLGRFTTKRGFSRTNKIVTGMIVTGALYICDVCEILSVPKLRSQLSRQIIQLKSTLNTITEIPRFISEFVNVKDENKKLRLKIDKLKIMAVDISDIKKEIEELKRNVNLMYSSSLYKNIEKVLGFDKSMYDSFVIISATHKETREGAVVISSDGLVGLVFDIKGDIARVLPITNRKMAVPVRTQDGVHLIIAGTDRNELIVKEIQNNAVIGAIKCGDALHTSGEGGVLMKDIPVAKVTRIGKKPDEVFAEPVTAMEKLNFVWIIDPVLEREVASTSN
ncbi:MAG: rod shape-determining protein MreC [Holosporales bacterium]|nr:rod shape-determining protein MreC [Holosporales bacterium]